MAQAAIQQTLVIYRDENGNEPFTDWLNKLRDQKGRRRILTRLRRLEQGNYGDCEPVGGGVSELRMFFGSGYRIYFGKDANNIILVICGGDKSSQSKDIKFAKARWREYQNND